MGYDGSGTDDGSGADRCAGDDRRARANEDPLRQLHVRPQLGAWPNMDAVRESAIVLHDRTRIDDAEQANGGVGVNDSARENHGSRVNSRPVRHPGGGVDDPCQIATGTQNRESERPPPVLIANGDNNGNIRVQFTQNRVVPKNGTAVDDATGRQAGIKKTYNPMAGTAAGIEHDATVATGAENDQLRRRAIRTGFQ